MLNISGEIYEAAYIDGASELQKFFSITLPMTKRTTFTLVIVGIIGALKMFELPYIMTNGGPNHATETFATYIYKYSFDLFEQGMSSALAMVVLVVALIITGIQLRIYAKQEE